MAKLNKYKLETEFHDKYVVSPAYEWNLSERRPSGFWKWKQEKILGSGAFGTVHLKKEQNEGQLRAVKIIRRHDVGGTGFTQELLALITLMDVRVVTKYISDTSEITPL